LTAVVYQRHSDQTSLTLDCKSQIPLRYLLRISFEPASNQLRTS